MISSKGEKRIENALAELELTFCREYVFSNLKGRRNQPLRFDFAVFDDTGKIDFLIEYQGRQHYESVDFFGGTKALLVQAKNDERKRTFCLLNEIPLISFSYLEEEKITGEYILFKYERELLKKGVK